MHLVETMAYAGEAPWHGLGKKLQAQQPSKAGGRMIAVEERRSIAS